LFKVEERAFITTQGSSGDEFGPAKAIKNVANYNMGGGLFSRVGKWGETERNQDTTSWGEITTKKQKAIKMVDYIEGGGRGGGDKKKMAEIFEN